MTIVATVEAIVLILVVFLFLRQERELERSWAVERRELLTRIQRPELIPTAISEPFVVPELESDEIEMVGTIADPPPGDSSQE